MKAEDFLIAVNEPPTDIKRLEGSPKQPGKQEQKPKEAKNVAQKTVDSGSDEESEEWESSEEEEDSDDDSSQHSVPKPKLLEPQERKSSIGRNKDGSSASFTEAEAAAERKKPKAFVNLAHNKNISRSFQAKGKGDEEIEKPSPLKRAALQPVFTPTKNLNSEEPEQPGLPKDSKSVPVEEEVKKTESIATDQTVAKMEEDVDPVFEDRPKTPVVMDKFFTDERVAEEPVKIMLF